jgi:hypothetical protein
MLSILWQGNHINLETTKIRRKKRTIAELADKQERARHQSPYNSSQTVQKSLVQARVEMSERFQHLAQSALPSTTTILNIVASNVA